MVHFCGQAQETKQSSTRVFQKRVLVWVMTKLVEVGHMESYKMIGIFDAFYCKVLQFLEMIEKLDRLKYIITVLIKSKWGLSK